MEIVVKLPDIDLPVSVAVSPDMTLAAVADATVTQHQHRLKGDGPWGLRRTAGEALDESQTLAENGVEDGEVLELTAA